MSNGSLLPSGFEQNTPNQNIVNSTNYYVSNSGNDANPGSLLLPKKTLSAVALEFYGKVINGVVNIYLLDSITDSPYFDLDIYRQYTSYVYIQGTKTLIGSGSITALQQYALPPTFEDQQITDDNLPTSWTASGFVEKIIYLTSGANSGSYAWIYQDIGLKTAIVSPFFNPSTYQQISPDIGDTYSVYSIPKLSGSLLGTNKGSVYVENIDIDTGVPNPGIEPVSWSGGDVTFFGCRINGNDTYPSPPSSYGGHMIISKSGICTSYGCYISTHVRAFTGGTHYFGSCLFSGYGTAPTADGPGSSLSILTPCVGYGEQTFLQARNGGKVVVESGAWYMAANQAAGLWVRVGCEMVLQGKVWGFGITTVGVFMGSGADIYYGAEMIPDFVNNVVGPTYPTKQVDLGGTTKLYSDMDNSTGIYNTTNDAKIVPLYYIN